jgi:phosphohistidine phosphatase
MRILAVRHGEAGDAEDFARNGRPDHLRALTARGRKRMWLAARGIIRELPFIDALATSPYVRTVQTAEILSLAYENIAIQQIAQLESGAPLEPLIEWLAERPAEAYITLVGHMPDLAHLVTNLICNRKTPALKIKKGGACLITFDGDLQPGKGMLTWLMDAGQLGKLGGWPD